MIYEMFTMLNNFGKKTRIIIEIFFTYYRNIVVNKQLEIIFINKVLYVQKTVGTFNVKYLFYLCLLCNLSVYQFFY